jgi:hypothetical protein
MQPTLTFNLTLCNIMATVTSCHLRVMGLKEIAMYAIKLHNDSKAIRALDFDSIAGAEIDYELLAVFCHQNIRKLTTVLQAQRKLKTCDFITFHDGFSPFFASMACSSSMRMALPYLFSVAI